MQGRLAHRLAGDGAAVDDAAHHRLALDDRDPLVELGA
jgi:hypothetical protein